MELGSHNHHDVGSFLGPGLHTDCLSTRSTEPTSSCNQANGAPNAFQFGGGESRTCFPGTLINVMNFRLATQVGLGRQGGRVPYPQCMRTTRKDSVGTVAQSGELDLLRQIRARAGRQSGAIKLGIGDDCALIKPGHSEELAITTDLSIAGRHFRLDWHPPQSVGHRALARGLSDLAAMGARPVAAFLSLGLPRELTTATGRKPAWVNLFFDGLLALAAAHKTPLAGGDLAESPIPIADIVLIGAVANGKALRRSTARPGQLLYVSGTLGGAAAGLAKLAGLKPGRIPKKPRCRARSTALSPTPNRRGPLAGASWHRLGRHRHQRWAINRPRAHLRGIRSGS